MKPIIFVTLLILETSVHSFIVHSSSRKESFLCYKTSETLKWTDKWLKRGDYSLMFPSKSSIENDLNTPPIIPKQKTVKSFRSDPMLTTETNSESNLRETRGPEAWSVFKDITYSSLDYLGRMGKSLGKKDSPTNQIFNGYSDTVEKSILTSPSIRTRLETVDNILIADSTVLTPGARLLKQYEESLQSNTPIDSLSDDRSISAVLFESTKDFFYKVYDSLQRSKDDTNRTPSTYESSFKAVARTSVNEEESVQTLSSLLPELKSPNLITRVKAYLILVESERKQKRRLSEMRNQKMIYESKERIYSAIDSVQKVGDSVTHIPEKIEQFIGEIEETIVDTTEKAQNFVQEVQAIPDKVTATIENIQDATDETIRVSSVVIQDIQNIPATLQEGIRETSLSIDRTKQNINEAVNHIQDFTFGVKVFVGLERPKPVVPVPPPPPPPKSKQQIALEATGFVFSSAGKIAWFIGKGMINLGVSASKFGWTAYVDSRKRDQERLERDEPIQKGSISTDPLVSKDITASYQDINLAQIDPALDREVTDALRLAADAMKKSVEIEKKKKSDALSAEIEEALSTAKAAAAQAVNDAAALEQIVKKL